jgi:hypothetical protein
MIYRGPGFLAVVCFESTTILFPPSPVASLSQSSYVSPAELTDGNGGGGWGGGSGRGAESYEKAWPSINRTILSSFKLIHNRR